eukprot:GHVP01022082.1.p1 GENE.GHVP01022082.1~~GHVP01022082.1.p1  ORF type:complete len:251 (+),score=48.16 GHVP01022082.1:22-774(+)
MHFQLLEKTSAELNAAAFQTNIGDNLLKENLLREDLKIEELQFSGAAQTKIQRESPDGENSGISFTDTSGSLLTDAQEEAPQIFSLIKGLEGDQNKICKNIMSKLKNSRLNIHVENPPRNEKFIWNFLEDHGKLKVFFLAYFPIELDSKPEEKPHILKAFWNSMTEKLEQESFRNLSLPILPLTCSDGQKFFNQGKEGTKINCFCFRVDLFKKEHSDFDKLIRQLLAKHEDKQKLTIRWESKFKDPKLDL